ncbi:aldose epimerase family protein [Victivallis vadensis]|uniref:Aldose 1-epimerase n=1 Tax=Victivallis vadensis TaxID=172901 RepID=A0A2U1B1L8_9BACT|nr:aldose epimerase family protein [Victivallis vadensis]NMD88797.1 galactose mutarotase [Victivallis vadensis]PVY42576.1 aldose 1-epimerase [Victivallis vadensis]
MKIQDFFQLPDGRTARLYSLRNSSGFGADITDFGGAIVRLLTPDRNGKLVDVVLGFAEPADYIENGPFFGALIGRVANRISNGRFTLGGKTYQLELNDSNGKNTLHGGRCYGRRLWEAEVVDDYTLKLTLNSPDGDAGFPGNVKVEVVYHITEDNALSIAYSGTSDAPTVLSLTNHSYFNLNGEGAGECGDHSIMIQAGRRTEVDEFLAPTGRNPEVAGTFYDLRAGKSFAKIHEENPNCFDDNFVLSDEAESFKENVAVAWSDRTGIELACSTTAPGVQFYMGFFLDGTLRGKTESSYPQFSAFCLETQLWPDAVNHPEFPSARLNPGGEYKQYTVYKFGVRN